MCFDDQARPPVPDATHLPAHGEDLVLTAADGNQFLAYVARPAQPTPVQIIVLPDGGGLRPYFKSLTLRLAEIGFTTIAFDYFGRTAGLTPRDDSFDWREHVPHVKPETTFLADLTAAIARLRADAGEQARATFALGFCMGGTLAFWSGTTDLGLAGAIGFYAHVGDEELRSAAAQITTPLLGLFGDADQFIPVDDVRAFDRQLNGLGIEHEFVLYPGAPHGFFEIEQEAYEEASADAWRRMLAFIRTHTPTTTSDPAARSS
jgi:carboxymethylenebutenolidase